MKISGKLTAIWSVIAALLFLSSALPNAYGLEFPRTTHIELEPESAAVTAQIEPIQNVAALYGSIELASTPIGSIFSSDVALVSSVSRQVEMARTIVGAKIVAKTIMAQELGMNASQFSCLNSLWTVESHWNYKAHNYQSGAQGIAQALPPEKMSVIANDWRSNPVTQIRWGLLYITLRYETPCKAWSHFKRTHYY